MAAGTVFMGDWGKGMIFGGCVGALFGISYALEATNYTVPMRGGGSYPGDRGD